ncbi:hypothetical protein F444_13101, partial [Phytophthora nicotianae P1976]
MLLSILQPSEQQTQRSTNENATGAMDTEQISIFPPAIYWEDLYIMYWNSDEIRHQFKPISEWTYAKRKKCRVLSSRLSVVKLFAEDVRNLLTKRVFRSSKSRQFNTLCSLLHKALTEGHRWFECECAYN